MYFKTCVICGLKSGRKLNEKRVFMTRFPRDEARCKQWVKNIGKNNLAHVPIEKLHLLKYVCGKHFKPRDFNRKKTRMKKSAVPTLFLNREPLTDDLLEEFPLHIAKKNLTIRLKADSSYNSNNEHNYFMSLPSERERVLSPDFIGIGDTDANDSSSTILQRVAEQTINYVGRSRSISRSPSNRASRSRSRSQTSISDMVLFKEIKLEEQESYLIDSELTRDYDCRERQTPGWDIQKSPVRDRYRGPLRDEQRYIRKSTIKRAIMNRTIKSDNFPVLDNILPDFDPSSKKQSINAWLSKVEECANINRWNEQQIIHNALSKLSGQAKYWYQCLPSRKQSWIQWKALLTKTYPAYENYADLFTEMLNKKMRVGEPFELYYHSKMDLLNRCNIVGQKAVDCLVRGIDDRSVREEAEAANFEKPDQVIQFLRNLKVRPKDFRSYNEKHRSSTNNSLNNNVNNQGQVYIWANWG